MANLIHIKNSELSPTLDILGKMGVQVEDFADIRTYPFFAQKVAAFFTERRKKIEAAIGDQEGDALLAIKEIDDPKLLVEIINQALLVSVCKAALAKLPGSGAFRIALSHSHREVIKEALKRTPDHFLANLAAETQSSSMRVELAKAEYARRQRGTGGKNPEPEESPL